MSVCTELHCNICKATAVQLYNQQRYDDVPTSVGTSNEGKVTILWNQPVLTDRTIPNNKPDSILCDNKQGTRMSTDVVISGGRNVIKREAEKILKCKDLTI